MRSPLRQSCSHPWVCSRRRTELGTACVLYVKLDRASELGIACVLKFLTGANSVASFQKRHSRRSFDNCGSAPTSRDLSNRKVPQEWRGGHACVAASGITGGPISLAICFHGDLSTRGPHLGLGPSVDGGFRFFYICFTFIFEPKARLR